MPEVQGAFVINLAGHKDPDRFVEEELFVAGVEIVRAPEPRKTEVATRITGKLGPFTFTRAWYYWIVVGRVPLPIARALYEQKPYGRRDVRVEGHCGCPAPEDPWLTYVSERGREIVLVDADGGRGAVDKKSFDDYRAGRLDGLMVEIYDEMIAKYDFVETREQRLALAGPRIYVDGYHIDSQGGLKVFCDAVRGLEVDTRAGADTPRR